MLKITTDNVSTKNIATLKTRTCAWEFAVAANYKKSAYILIACACNYGGIKLKTMHVERSTLTVMSCIVVRGRTINFQIVKQENCFPNAGSGEAAFVPQTNFHTLLLLDRYLPETTGHRGAVAIITQILLN